MTAKLKSKFLPRYYQFIVFRKMQNFKKKMMTVMEYTEEFYNVNIRSGYIKDTPEIFAKYIYGLRFDIKYELCLMSLRSVEEA